MRYAVLLSLVLLAAIPSSGQAAVRNVPAEYPTIQAAISAAADGDTILVAAGTYVESGQIVINKNLTIIGAGAENTTIKPAQDTGGSGDARGWFLVNAGKTLALSHLTLDGDSPTRKVHTAVRSWGSLDVQDCSIKNMVYPGYDGRGLGPYGDTNIIRRVTFSNMGRIGVLVFGSGVSATIEDCTYVGKGTGDWLDYAFEAGGGAQATITNCRISDCVGVASVDGSTSAGILVTTYYGAGTTATISGCTITNCTEAIAAGYDSADTSVVIAHYNNLAGNESGIGNTSSTVTVDAETNWWGTTDGQSIATLVWGLVDYTPWLTSPVQRLTFTPALVKSLMPALHDASYQWGLWAVRARPVVGGSGDFTIIGGGTNQPGWGVDAPSSYSWHTYGTNCAWFWDASGAEVANTVANPLYMIMDMPANTFTSYGFNKNGQWVADYPPTWLEPGYDDGYGGTNLVTATDDDAEMSFTFALGAGATWDGRWQFLVDGSKYTLGTESDPGDWIANFFGDYGTGGGIPGNMGQGFSGANILALDVTPASLYVKPGETVTVKLNQRYLAQNIAGYQAFVSFEQDKLSFSSGAYTSSPYEMEIITPITAISGNIDMAAGTVTPTDDDAELAVLSFIAGSTEGVTQVVFRDNDPETLFTDDQGEPIPPTLIDSAYITIDGTNPAVTVTAPNGGEYLKGGGSTTITWTATDANMDPNSIAIDYWNGSAWVNIATGEANDGSYTWSPIPLLDISTAKIRVTATDLAGNSAGDDSDAPFTIDSTKPTIDNIKLTVAQDGSGPDLTPSGTAIQGTYYVSAYVSDNLAGIDWTVLPVITVTDSASNSLVTGSVTADPANGRFYVQITVTASSANGTANINVSGVTDKSGNVSDPASDTFIVNKTQAVVTVQLAGVTVDTQRWIKFVIGGSAGSGQRLVITRQVSFAAGNPSTGTVAFTDLPANADWTKISAKDEQHTLRKLADLVDSGNRQYSATLVLQGGDATNDNLIDIRDFGVFAGQWGTTPDPNSQWPAKNANFDCTGTVGTPDFTFIQIGFLGRGDAEPSYAGPLSAELPLTSVSLAEMKKLIGMPAALKADVNRDGIIDLTDVKLFLRSRAGRGG